MTNYKFGFELEGFYLRDGLIVPPAPELPTDGFPGLVEVRNYSYGEIHEQYFDILRQIAIKCKDVCFETHTHTYKPQEKALLLSRGFQKGGDVINNIYGKAPKALGNRTIASFQINFSVRGNVYYVNKEGVSETKSYSELIDFLPIIRALDEEFAEEIRETKRQPGWYSIKDASRVEYRSLPNCVFEKDIESANELIERINSCFK